MFCLEIRINKNATAAMESSIVARIMNSVHYWNLNNRAKIQVNFPGLGVKPGHVIRIFSLDDNATKGFGARMPRDMGVMYRLVSIEETPIPATPKYYAGIFRERNEVKGSASLRRLMKRRAERGETSELPVVQRPSEPTVTPFFVAHSASTHQAYPFFLGVKTSDRPSDCQDFNPTSFGLTSKEDCFMLPVW